jgi:hypothetical protein
MVCGEAIDLASRQYSTSALARSETAFYSRARRDAINYLLTSAMSREN